MVLLSGCMAGGGPVVAFRGRNTVAFGWDGSVSVVGVGLQAGNTFAVHGPTAGYIAARGVLPIAPDNKFDGNYQLGLGGTLGWGTADGHRGWSTGLWTQYLSGDLGGCDGTRVYSIQLGLRRISTETEFFVSPQINTYGTWCAD